MELTFSFYISCLILIVSIVWEEEEKGRGGEAGGYKLRRCAGLVK